MNGQIATIAAPTIDLDGHVRFDRLDPSSDMHSIRRRVSRTATLDGGVAVTDFGYSAGDRTITMRFQNDTAQKDLDALRRMMRIYAELIIYTHDGAFIVAPQSYSATGPQHSATFLVSSALNEVF